MQITMSVGQLRSVMSRALGVTGTKTGSMPILSTVLLEAEQTAEGGMLTSRAYDLEIGIESRVPCEVRRPGAAAVPAKLLADVAKVLPESSVQLTLEANRKLAVTSGAASFRLATLAAEDFPKLPEVPSAVGWTPVADGALVAALDRVTYAMSSDETRYNLNGALFDPAAGGLTLVCTDGHRMALDVVAGLEIAGLKDGAIVGRKAIDELRALLSEAAPEPGEMAFAGNAVLYRRQGLLFTARLIDGAFPDYTQVVPEVSPTAALLTVSRSALRDVLRRVLLMADDQASGVVLALAEGKLVVTARSADAGEARDEVAVDYRGPALEVAVNGRYLAELIAAEGGESIVAAITGDAEPLVLMAAADAAGRHVVMPMRR